MISNIEYYGWIVSMWDGSGSGVNYSASFLCNVYIECCKDNYDSADREGEISNNLFDGNL